MFTLHGVSVNHRHWQLFCLFSRKLIQANIDESIKLLINGPLWGESIRIPFTKGQWYGNRFHVTFIYRPIVFGGWTSRWQLLMPP